MLPEYGKITFEVFIYKDQLKFGFVEIKASR